MCQTRKISYFLETLSFTFNKEGTFGYHSKPWQRGTVTVLPPDYAGVSLQIQPPDSPDDKEYSLKIAVRKGYYVIWDNIDNKTHTITSKSDNGKSFSSGLIQPWETFTLDTSSLKNGYYEYFDSQNLELSDIIRVIDPKDFEDNKLIEDTKRLPEVRMFLEKYPQAFSYVDHDFFDNVTFGMMKKIDDTTHYLTLSVIYGIQGDVQTIFASCGGGGGVGMDTPNSTEYLKIEKCLEK